MTPITENGSGGGSPLGSVRKLAIFAKSQIAYTKLAQLLYWRSQYILFPPFEQGGGRDEMCTTLLGPALECIPGEFVGVS
jgi:hypothetical protein